jgi:hypothetical protein
MLTIFTTPKPFEGHIDVIQRNAIESWTHLSDQVQVILIGDEPGMRRVAVELEVTHLPHVEHNQYGTPRLDSIFASAREHARHRWLCYVNADIILLDDLLPTVKRVTTRFDRFLIVGQRYDLGVTDRLQFDDGWQDRVRALLSTDGKLHPPAGSDYFVFQKDEFAHMPPFALGRAGWDNWMIFAGRELGLPVIDASGAITLVHQNHDYGHLPGGQPHYRLPESEDNIRMAGGRATVFTLQDVNWRVGHDSIQKLGLIEGPFFRRIESELIARLGAGKPARLVQYIFRPRTTVKYYWRALLRRVGRMIKSQNRS